jgi:hypothetical protein
LRADVGFRCRNCSRGAARRGAPAGADAASEAPQFVPAVVEWGSAGRRGSPTAAPQARPVDLGSGIIEVEIGDDSVRVGRGADVGTVAVVIRALKAVT